MMPQPPIAPGPQGQFLVGSALEFKKSPLDFLLKLTQTYGDIVRFKLGPKTAFLLTHPDFAQRVLLEQPDHYPKGGVWEIMRQVSGNGLIASEGAYWRKQRQRVQPAFSHDRMGSYVTVMTQTIHEMLDLWQDYAQTGQPFDVCPEMLKMVSLLAARSLFGVEESGEVELTATFMHNLQAALANKIRGALPLPLFVPTPTNIRIKTAKQRFDAIADRMIAHHRQTGGDRGDLLSAMMLARDQETGEAMSDQQLRDEVMTLFVAGHETSGRLLPFILHLLAKAPEVEQKLLTEIKAVVGDRTPTFADVLQLKYAKQVFDEALRLYPPIYFIFREAAIEDEIASFQIPRGSIIFLSPYVTHRHPEYWSNPEAFDPDRFAIAAAAKQHKFAYFPFGGGPHTCIGPNFAALEVMLTLVMLLQRYQVQLLSNPPLELDALMILAPRHGIQVTLKSRTQADSTTEATLDD
jgi:cytochrome P450